MNASTAEKLLKAAKEIIYKIEFESGYCDECDNEFANLQEAIEEYEKPDNVCRGIGIDKRRT